jgi:uncharacterized protein (TIGR03437 family)
MFPLGSFSKSGTYRTVTQGSTGTLAVEVTDDLSVLNSAGYGFCGPGAGILCMTNQIAPGEAATVFGSDNMAGATPAVTVVDAKGIPRLAQLLYVSPAQINFVVPPETTPGTATIIVANGTRQSSVTANIRSVAPGIFTANGNGAGVPAAQIMRVRSDGSYVSEEVVSWDAAAQQWVAKPVAIGSDLVYLILYATGIRNRVGPLQVGCWCPDRPITLPVTYAGA